MTHEMTFVSSFLHLKVVTKHLSTSFQLCVRIGIHIGGGEVVGRSIVVGGGNRDVLIAKSILNDIVVSHPEFMLSGGRSREDIALVIIVAHLILRVVESRLSLCHSLQVLLDCHDRLLARLVALDDNCNSDDQENDCNNDRNDDHHIRS